MIPVPYCGLAPTPGSLLDRFNADPVLAVVLALLLLTHWHLLAHRGSAVRTLQRYAITGWLVAAMALMSPLCALSVSLFSARVAQHMLLLLVAAPLVARGLPLRSSARGSIWITAVLFMLALWFWHMPVPYDATFTSSRLYWCMHASLFGSGVLLWRQLLNHRAGAAISAFAAGTFTSMQMGLLGALLTFAGHPQFIAHLSSAPVWGFTPLQDQQLGGAIMWIPGMLVFLWTALRSLVLAGATARRVGAAG